METRSEARKIVKSPCNGQREKKGSEANESGGSRK